MGCDQRRRGIEPGHANLLAKKLTMFDLEQFIANCRAALAADRSHKNVREVVARAVVSLLPVKGEQSGRGQKLYHSDDLTILNVICGGRADSQAPQSSDVGGHRRLYRSRDSISGAAYRAIRRQAGSRGRLSAKCPSGTTSFTQ
jgi:hypothetical protein